MHGDPEAWSGSPCSSRPDFWASHEKRSAQKRRKANPAELIAHKNLQVKPSKFHVRVSEISSEPRGEPLRTNDLQRNLRNRGGLRVRYEKIKSQPHSPTRGSVAGDKREKGRHQTHA